MRGETAKTGLIALVLVFGLAACGGQVAEIETTTTTPIAAEGTPTTEAPEATTLAPAPTTTVAPKPTTTVPPVLPPTVALDCPDDFAFAWGTAAMVTFGYSFAPGSAADAQFEIDYGDGRQYQSSSAEDAKKNLFWHEYAEPGLFTAMVEVTSENGLSAMDFCTFRFSWNGAPPARPPTPPGGSSAGFDPNLCTYNGISLYGKVQMVDFLPDFEVQVVDFLPDLRVQQVDFLANSCGKWEFVDFLPDFTIQFVDFLPDFKIEFVDYLPGT